MPATHIIGSPWICQVTESGVNSPGSPPSKPAVPAVRPGVITASHLSPEHHADPRTRGHSGSFPERRWVIPLSPAITMPAPGGPPAIRAPWRLEVAKPIRAPTGPVPAASSAVLHVDHVPCEAVDGFLDRLAQGRVGGDIAGGLVDGEVPLLGQGELGEEFGDVRADQVTAKELAVLG